MSRFCLPDGYHERTHSSHHDDRHFTDQYQDYVYRRAHEIAASEGYETVVDIGCGSGFKLEKYFSDYSTLGVELEPCLSFLVKKYPHKAWANKIPAHKFDLVICADVIEHVQDPIEFMEMLTSIKSKKIIISTPDRNCLVHRRSAPSLGPPVNPAHIREWAPTEFISFVRQYIDVDSHIFCSAECSQAIIGTTRRNRRLTSDSENKLLL